VAEDVPVLRDRIRDLEAENAQLLAERARARTPNNDIDIAISFDSRRGQLTVGLAATWYCLQDRIEAERACVASLEDMALPTVFNAETRQHIKGKCAQWVSAAQVRGALHSGAYGWRYDGGR
jgi:hypothetical protein